MIELVKLPAKELLRELLEDPQFRAHYRKLDKGFKHLENTLRARKLFVVNNEVNDELQKDD